MKSLNLASIFLFISGVIHFATVILTGFAQETLIMLVLGALYIATAYLLRKTGSRLLAWITFLMMLAFSVVALTFSGSGSNIPDVGIYSIVIFDWLTAMMLFLFLWRKKIAA